MPKNVPCNENPAPATTETPAVAPPPTIITVDTLPLQVALTKYVKVTANKNARLIVQGISVTAADDYLDLLGTDLEIALHVTVPATAVITPSNTIVADYKALLNAAKAVKERQTRLTLTGSIWSSPIQLRPPMSQVLAKSETSPSRPSA